MTAVLPDEEFIDDPAERAILEGTLHDPEVEVLRERGIDELTALHEANVVKELQRIRARHDATIRFTAELADRAKAELQQVSRVRDGATFLLDIDPTPPALWGKGDQVIWARGESLIIGGPQGVGKTTVAGQLLRACIGICDDKSKLPEVFGFPVQGIDGHVGYLAMDRPEQARRALGRMFGPEHRNIIADMLRFWSGPLPTDAATDPFTLVRIAYQLDAEVLFVDSLKDAAVGLSKDEVGAGYNRARQMALSEGIQLVELHHVVKNAADGGKPNNLNGLYGSTWITAGAGSVIMLWGDAGDEIIELTHLKQPMSDVGPLLVRHNRETGLAQIHHDPDKDLVLIARRCTTSGLMAKEAAQSLFGTEKPTASQTEKARRKLVDLAKKGLLVHLPADKSGRGSADRWVAAAPESWSPGRMSEAA